MDLPPRAFDTLLALVGNEGRLLEKEALMRAVWGETVVEENNLTQVIYLLRKTLRDGDGGIRYIETVPKRGYRFVAEVKRIDAAPRNGDAHNGAGTIGALSKRVDLDPGPRKYAGRSKRGREGLTWSNCRERERQSSD